MKALDSYIIMIRTLKVLWYYKRLKINKLGDWQGCYFYWNHIPNMGMICHVTCVYKLAKNFISRDTPLNVRKSH